MCDTGRSKRTSIGLRAYFVRVVAAAGVVLGGVAIANQRHVDILTRDSVRAWNLWRQENLGILPDLSGADLSRADLRRADLRRADLFETDLSGADLSEADLRRAHLSRAHLSRAHLSRARLSDAHLGWAHLGDADLFEANLRDANLGEANLAEVNLGRANLSRANLAEARLNRANLSDAHLFEARLSRANLFEANLSEARLIRADLTRADLTRADLSDADLFEANLTGADLSGATCIRTRFSGAILTGCIVYGISAWDVNLDDAKQADLRITPADHKTNITVDNVEVAQFLYLLLSNRKVRNVLDTITSKVVLILGRFSAERKPILDALREALRSHPNGYIPVLFDFEPQHDKPVFETVKTLANLARFVIADLTDPNMVRSELTYITANLPTVPVQPVMQRDANLPTEYGTWTGYKSFLAVYRYDDLAHLLASLTEAVIEPVEGHVVARRLADADSR